MIFELCAGGGKGLERGHEGRGPLDGRKARAKGRECEAKGKVKIMKATKGVSLLWKPANSDQVPLIFAQHFSSFVRYCCVS